MTDRYEPPEHKIEEVIAKTGGDPRKLAIAYLRAQKRARDADTAFDVMDGVTGAFFDVATGDGKGATEKLEKVNRKLRRHAEITETERGEPK